VPLHAGHLCSLGFAVDLFILISHGRVAWRVRMRWNVPRQAASANKGPGWMRVEAGAVWNGAGLVMNRSARSRAYPSLPRCPLLLTLA